MPAFSHHGAAHRAGGRQRRWMLILLAAMAATLSGCAWSLGGGLVLALAACALFLGVGGIAIIPAAAVMDLHRAVPMPAHRHPEIAVTLAGLAERAGLKTPPVLYRLPGPGLNALAAGRAGHSAIGLSDETLSVLPMRELRAVLAHEISHVAAGDTGLLALTCLISRLTQGTAEFALAAAALLLLATGSAALSAGQVVLFVAAVPAMSLLQFALSRNQEFAADLGAVRLTDDPIGLVAALERIEMLEPLDIDGRGGGGLVRAWGGLLRSHPPPRQRIARLLDRLYRTRTARPVPLNRPVLDY